MGNLAKGPHPQSKRQTFIPVIVIGGFLGAGKTTLLNHILGSEHGIRAGVLVNDFGAVNIDAKLVASVTEDTVDLSNGCVCCGIREDLIAACLGLLRRPDPPEVLIIETSGVSDPVEVVRTLESPALGPRLNIDSLITVVDAESFFALLTGELVHLIREQIEAADIVVLNKTDLIDKERLRKVRARVQAMAPRSRRLETHHGQAPLALLVGVGANNFVNRNNAHAALPHDHSRDSLSKEIGHPFTTWHWTSNKPLSLPKLQKAIEALPNTIYRAKGLVYLEELPAYRVVFQMVGKRYNLRDTEPWETDSPGSEIVLIAVREGIDTIELQRSFDDCLGIGDEYHSPVLRLSRRLAAATGAHDRHLGEIPS